MAAEIRKNSAIASERQVDLVVQANGYGPAPVETDFIALGILFVPDAANVPHYMLGSGTCVNKRRPVAIADDVVEAVDAGVDTLTLTAHLYKNLDGPVYSDEVMGTVAIGDPFFVIRVDDNTIAIAESLGDAIAGTRVALAGTEDGATISDDADTMRGIPGKFTYTFTPDETNNSLTELSVLIEGTGFEESEGGGGYSTANLPKVVEGFESQMESDGTTYGAGARATFRGETQDYTRDSSGNYMHKKPDGTDSHGGTVTGAGRTKNIPAGGLDP